LAWPSIDEEEGKKQGAAEGFQILASPANGAPDHSSGHARWLALGSGLMNLAFTGEG
jgi:hypothetical protein